MKNILKKISPLLDLDLNYHQARKRILDWILLISTGFGFPALVFGLIEAFQLKEFTILIHYAVFFLPMVVALLFRNKLSYNLKGALLLSSIYALALSNVIVYGFSGASIELFFFLFAMSAILYGGRISLLSMVASLIPLVLVGWLMVTRRLAPGIDMMVIIYEPISWITALAVTIFIGSIMIFSISFLQKNLVRSLKENEKRVRFLQTTLDGTIETLVKTVEARDSYTAGHQMRVADLSVAIAKEMGLRPKQVKGIEMAARIHDLGKIQVPADILNKYGKLSEYEFEIVKNHAALGHELLEPVEFNWPVAEIVWQHHERIDGSGYPRGLKKDEILIEARIIGVADVVEAMTSHRPYRPALTMNDAKEEMEQNAGKTYDPEVVRACLDVFSAGYQLPPNVQ